MKEEKEIIIGEVIDLKNDDKQLEEIDVNLHLNSVKNKSEEGNDSNNDFDQIPSNEQSDWKLDPEKTSVLKQFIEKSKIKLKPPPSSSALPSESNSTTATSSPSKIEVHKQ